MAATACNSRKPTSPRPPRTAGTATEVPGQLEPRATRARHPEPLLLSAGTRCERRPLPRGRKLCELSVGPRATPRTHEKRPQRPL